MPASLKRIRETGTPVLLHVCDECGQAAGFGVGVSILAAVRHLNTGDKESAKVSLGSWFCREHWGGLAP